MPRCVADRVAFAAAVLLVAALSGCTAPGATPSSAGSAATTPTAAACATVTAGPAPMLTVTTLPHVPGTKWTHARFEGPGTTPVRVAVSGPWTFTADGAWPIVESEVVAVAAVPSIDSFVAPGYVVRTTAGGQSDYAVRCVTDEWLLDLGRVEVRGADVKVDVNAEPQRVWPLGFEEGGTYLVAEDGAQRTEATVLGRGTAVVPAGIVPDTWLVRFRRIPESSEATAATLYRFLAGGVGLVAEMEPVEGSEAAGFLSAASLQVLTALPVVPEQPGG